MTTTKKYLTCAETAKHLRAALKRAFAGVKFSVKSKTYSGGASIDISWTDGPTTKLVDAVAQQFAGGGFDGMIDLKYNVDHWLLADGSTAVAHSEGTAGSGGSVPAVREWMPQADAVLVSFGADYVFTSRTHSERFIRHACARLARNGYPQFADVEIEISFRNAWIKNANTRLYPTDHWCHEDMGQLLHKECAKLVVA